MKLKIFALVALTLTLNTTAYAEPSADESIKFAESLSAAFQKAADNISRSVVTISTTTKAPSPGRRGGQLPPHPFFDPFRDFFDEDNSPLQAPDRGKQQGMGSGVIVDDAGHILTNNHVVGDADELMVQIGEQKPVKAKLVGTDPRSDLAVIQIKTDGVKLEAAPFGNSDKLKIGEWVIAAGNPFGLDNTITAGIVSAKGRSIMGGNQYEDFIQTDAAINPGNSGGPLVNLRGEVIGINTAIFSRSGGYQGIGFAIPSNMAKSVMASLISTGKVVRGWLGVGIQNLTEDLAKSFNYPGVDGALVGSVQDGSPAEKAGVKEGDIITALDGEAVKNINQLRNNIAAMPPGKNLHLDIVREGRKQEITVKVGELPAEQTTPDFKDDSSSDIGLSVETLSPELAARLRSKLSEGVVVRAVRPGSIAEESGLQPKDIIVNVNGSEVKSVESFGKIIEKADLKKGIRLIVESKGMKRFVFLKSED